MKHVFTTFAAVAWYVVATGLMGVALRLAQLEAGAEIPWRAVVVCAAALVFASWSGRAEVRR